MNRPSVGRAEGGSRTAPTHAAICLPRSEPPATTPLEHMGEFVLELPNRQRDRDKEEPANAFGGGFEVTGGHGQGARESTRRE